MAVGYHGQVIMIFPDSDVVMVKTGRGWCRLDKLADLVSSSVKSDTSLPVDGASAKLLANEILDVSNREAYRSRLDLADGGYHLRKGVQVSLLTT
jgi:hypothetical protein